MQKVDLMGKVAAIGHVGLGVVFIILSREVGIYKVVYCNLSLTVDRFPISEVRVGLNVD
jgi:hypothetical protein